MSLQGKVALVTGGAQGIGRAMVESLLQEGASVVFCDWNRGVGNKTLTELTKQFGNKCMFVHCDVTDDKQFEDCFKTTISRFHKLDILLNNAGISNEGEWRKMINLNLVSVIHGTHLGLKYMSKEYGGQGGVIVNTASVSAFGIFNTIPIYSATKAAVNQFSRCIGTDLYFRRSGVKVMAISPGKTDTLLISNSMCEQKEHILEEHEAALKAAPDQPASNVSKGVIEVLKKGENGSLWLIENNLPPVLSTWTVPMPT